MEGHRYASEGSINECCAAMPKKRQQVSSPKPQNRSEQRSVGHVAAATQCDVVDITQTGICLSTVEPK